MPINVSASVLPDASKLNDTLNILIQFENGSSGIIGYYANGPKSMKEYIEVFSSGVSAILNDFKEHHFWKNKAKKYKII